MTPPLASWRWSGPIPAGLGPSSGSRLALRPGAETEPEIVEQVRRPGDPFRIVSGGGDNPLEDSQDTRGLRAAVLGVSSRSRSWTISAIARRASSATPNRSSRTSNAQRSPSWGNSPWYMSKRTSSGEVSVERSGITEPSVRIDESLESASSRPWRSTKTPWSRHPRSGLVFDARSFIGVASCSAPSRVAVCAHTRILLECGFNFGSAGGVEEVDGPNLVQPGAQPRHHRHHFGGARPLRPSLEDRLCRNTRASSSTPSIFLLTGGPATFLFIDIGQPSDETRFADRTLSTASSDFGPQPLKIPRVPHHSRGRAKTACSTATAPKLSQNAGDPYPEVRGVGRDVRQQQQPPWMTRRSVGRGFLG